MQRQARFSYKTKLKRRNLYIIVKYSSSRPKVFYTKSVLKNVAKFTRKHLCQSLFFK